MKIKSILFILVCFSFYMQAHDEIVLPDIIDVMQQLKADYPQHSWSSAYSQVYNALQQGLMPDAQQVQQVLNECKALDAQQDHPDLKHTIAQLLIYQQHLLDLSKDVALPITKAGRAVFNALAVTNNVEIDGSLLVEGNCRINGNELIAGNLRVDGNIIIEGQTIEGNE